MISAGVRAGRWTTVRALGEGGGGTVWLGLDDQENAAAIKFFPIFRASREEFRKEAAVALRNRHPNLLRLLDAGLLADNTPWLALEFVDGEDLRTRLEEHPPNPADAARIVTQIFAALDALHRSGLAHGDVKPENVLIQGGLARLVDFGRARMHHLYGDEAVFPGTPPYMHPSLFRGGAPTPATDCFAAWVVLHECVAGQRPFAAPQLTEAQTPAAIPRRALADPALDRLVEAGIRGQLQDARAGWLALARYLRRREDVPNPLPPPPAPPAQLVQRALESVWAGTHTCLVGDAASGVAVLGSLHRAWALRGGTVLWARAGWGSAEEPLSGALSLASHAADALTDAELEHVAFELGELAEVLVAASPSIRAWLDVPTTPKSGDAAQLNRAIRAFIASCPRPLLIAVDGLDRIDGSSRRLFAGLGLAGVVVVGTASPRAPHGLSAEVPLPAVDLPPVDLDWLDPMSKELMRRAEVLGLPFGPRLAVASGLPLDVVEDCALEAEAVGAAIWTGSQLVARSPGPISAGDARRFAREAAQRLDAETDPLLVARYAALGDDTERLRGVLAAAVAEALRFDPGVALEFLRASPDFDQPQQLLRSFHVAVLARNMTVAGQLLARIQAEAGFSAADRAEAEAEFAFRTGQIVPALRAYHTVARELGRPVHQGVRGLVQDAVAIWRVWRGKGPPPRPDSRLARVFERLHDLHFTNDNGPMFRVHALWKEAAPESPRARALDVVWNIALGRPERALRLHEVVWRDVDAGADPEGSAVVLLHRGIARSWMGELAEAHADSLDAAERLLRVGDPYLAALAVGTVGVCAIHLGDSGPLRRTNDRLAQLVRGTGDVRSGCWVTGHEAVLAFMEGRCGYALELTRTWVAEADARDESTSVLAHRFLAELLMDEGQFEPALGVIEAGWSRRKKYRMQMDFTDAIAISALIGDGQSRAAKRRGLSGMWRYRQVVAILLRRSPRWRPRALVGDGWQRVADGDRELAETSFESAFSLALGLGQLADAWWALHHAALALGGNARAERARTFALSRGLRAEAFGRPT